MLKKIILLTLFTTILTVSSFAQSDIRKVNFRNFTYNAYCAGEETEKITVKNGEFSKITKFEEFTERFYFNIFSINYGDLDGDKKDEAVILSVCNTGGTGNFSEGFIYKMKAGKPTLLARIPGGDRAFGGLREARVENGLLVVDQNDADRNQANCCSEYAILSKFRLNRKKLVEVGRPVSRQLYPAQRISFSIGATETTLTLTVNEIKRLKIGARSGQTLTVSFKSPNAENVSVSLVEGEADVAEKKDGLTAKLTQNGDFVIQIQNTYKLPSQVTVTIEIK